MSYVRFHLLCRSRFSSDLFSSQHYSGQWGPRTYQRPPGHQRWSLISLNHCAWRLEAANLFLIFIMLI